MIPFFSLVILLACFNTLNSQLSNDCNQLLEHGVYDTLMMDTAKTSLKAANDSLCTAYNKYEQSGGSIGVEGSFEGIGIGGSWSDDKLVALGQYFCKQSSIEAIISSSGQIISQTVDKNVIDAWRECNKQFHAGLFVSRRFSPEVNPTSLSVDLQYKPDFPPDNYTIYHVIISPPEAFTCQGNLLDVVGVENEASGLLSMFCERNVSDFPMYSNGQLIKAPTAIIDIETSVGVVSTPFGAIVEEDFTNDITVLKSTVNELQTQVQQLNDSLNTQLQAMSATLEKRQIQSGFQFVPAENAPQEALPVHVDFPEAFTSTPKVVVSLCGVDSGATYTKMTLSLDGLIVNENGFDVNANSWAGSHFYSICVSWIAYIE